MQPLTRGKQTKEKGKTYGMGATRKFHHCQHRDFESYLLKLGKYRTENDNTVEEADPDLHSLITYFAQKFEQILSHGTIFGPFLDHFGSTFRLLLDYF